MTPVHIFILIITPIIVIVGIIGLVLITKSMLKNVDNLDEDENGFFDKRNKL